MRPIFQLLRTNLSWKLKITLHAQIIQLIQAEKFKKIENSLEFKKHNKGIESLSIWFLCCIAI
jgi:hypothetical protein